MITSVAITTRDSSHYIKNVIIHNHIIGFDKIYINIDYRTIDDTAHQINCLPPEILKKVSLFTSPIPGQGSEYKYMLPAIQPFTDWIAFFDDDEYLYLENHNTIHEWFNSLPLNDISHVVVPWLEYGSNKQVLDQPITNTIYEWYIRRGGRQLHDNIDKGNQHYIIKSIVSSSHLLPFVGKQAHEWYECHSMRNLGGKSIEPHGNEIQLKENCATMPYTDYCYDVALVHYHSGSMESYVNKCRRDENKISSRPDRKALMTFDRFITCDTNGMQILDERMLKYHDEALYWQKLCK